MSATILCATDLGDSGSIATAWASAWAKSMGGRLVLLHIDDANHPDLSHVPESIRAGAQTLAARLDVRRSEHTRALETVSEGLAVPCETRIASGRPWETIIEVGNELNAALIVVGPHAHGLGSTARRVVTHAERPVLLARGEAPDDLSGLHWTVGLEPGEPAKAGDHPTLLHRITTLAAATQGKLVLTRALPSIVPLPEADAVDTAAIMDVLLSNAREELGRLHTDSAVPSEVVVELGAPHHVLTTTAESRGGILAVGAHARGAIARFVLGSVSERCLREGTGPVYVERA